YPRAHGEAVARAGVDPRAAPGPCVGAHPAAALSAEAPDLEVSSWVMLGGGARVIDGVSEAVFDLRLGGGFTGAVGREGDVRLGPFVEVSTASFDGVQTVGGVEFFVGAIPRPLRMFYFSGEGAFSARLGAGWAWRDVGFVDARSAPVASLTLSYGYRAPFSLRNLESYRSPDPEKRATARYMIIARVWVGASVDLTGASAWQLTGGLEFEPVGAFRYLLGVY
ncbi:MAG: hypothetical protein R3A52_16765, partial [Polyangiales bacterium]